ncbi:hypothetical protein [Secundilactobacillus kimchicus]|uniref:hypothetical protein n=1 Tax=Secundilactobacillus kimchicus TaxID=528209 RepID=UPI0024A8CAD2|nr:hypothetical protein [Secundilactobacillus kimchicus]
MTIMRLLAAAYERHVPDVLLNPPKVTPEFKLKVALWATMNNASYKEVALEFGYLGSRQIFE